MNHYLIIGLIAAVIAAYFWGRGDGGELEASAWRDREVKAQQAYAEKERALTARYREQEHAAALAANAVAQDYEKELGDAKRSKDRALADARAGRLRLRDPGSASCPSGGGVLPAAATASGERDGVARGELSGAADPVLSTAATDFLVGLAGEADETVKQLSACQALVRGYAR